MQTTGATSLDQAREVGAERAKLHFHYRSLERTLISPSNLLAYGMDLRTVPSPTWEPTSGLRTTFHPHGLTTTGSTGLVNEAEAHAIAEQVRAHISSGDGRSIGIIAANTAQRDLLRHLLPQHAGADDRHEPIFIRTTHEIQGEERDIILVSTVYDGRDPKQRFGAFEGTGSIERLNVLLSRSRSEMNVHTSFRLERRAETSATNGRRAYLILHALIDCQAEAETRLSTPNELRPLLRGLGLRIDNLGTVIGLRYGEDRRYRLGLVITNDRRPEEHWSTIVSQLTAKGWPTLRYTEHDLVTKPKAIRDEISASLAAYAARRP